VTQAIYFLVIYLSAKVLIKALTFHNWVVKDSVA